MKLVIDATPLLFPVRFPATWGSVDVIINTLSIDDRIGERSTASFTVRDLAAALSFEQGDPCDIYDDDESIIFAGFVDSVDVREIAPGTGLLHDLGNAGHREISGRDLDGLLRQQGVELEKAQRGRLLKKLGLQAERRRFGGVDDTIYRLGGFYGPGGVDD